LIPPLPPRFLNWRLDNGRKVPCTHDGRMCDAHDQSNHLTYEQAASAGYGVAYAMRAEDGWFFLDLDKCRGADGAWSAEATAIYNSFPGAWAEISQSGAGLHIMGRCDPVAMGSRRNKWAGWLECYTDARFIAFGSTGWQVIGGGQDTGQDWTDQLLKLVPEREHLGELPEGVDPRFTGPEDDEKLIEMMLRSTGGAGTMFGIKVSLAQLWNAESATLAKQYPDYGGDPAAFDHSSADAALMAHLAFWTGRDMPRMDRLFRRSGLMREKYEKREDYRRDTIQNAARLCKTVYDRPAPAMVRGMPGVGSADLGIYLTVPEMEAHFKDCVYVRDLHRVMVPDGSMLKPEQFNAAYGGHMFQMMPDGTKPTDEAFKALTQNKAVKFPQAIRPCFRPEVASRHIDSDGAINVYTPANVEMRQGTISRFLDLLRKILPDERDRAILLSYMASMVQNPGVKFQWAPVLQGCEGNGKTAIFSTLVYAVGRQYSHQPKAKQIGGQFNKYLENKLLILVEEVHMQGRREMLDDLKPLITNTQIEVEGKGVDQRMIDNRANWVFCTNYKDAVLKSQGDRRYAIFFTAQQSPADLVRDGMTGSYFPQFWDWLRAEGYAAVAWYLKHYPIPADLDPAGLCHRAPHTSTTDVAIEESRGGFEQDILEAAQNNVQGFRNGWVSSWALDKLARECGYRVGRNKYGRIMESLGYEVHGRSSRPLMAENGFRPVLYKLPGVTVDYEMAQNYPLGK
jgi:hypothetical protein